MSKMVGQDMLTGMGFIGTKPGMYRMTPTSLAERLKIKFRASATGERFSSFFYNLSEKDTDVGEKRNASVGLSCTPSTDKVLGQDDFAAFNAFFIKDCNFIVKDNGQKIPIALDGDKNFSRIGKVDVGVLTPPLYYGIERVTNGEIWHLSDKPLPGLVLMPHCKDNSGRPMGYGIVPKYYAGRIGGILYGSSGLSVNNFISYQSLHTEMAKKGAGYVGCGSERSIFLKTMLRIKYAVSSSQNRFKGCTEYNYQYAAAEAATGVNYITLTKSQANAFYVGCTVSVGEAGENTNLDRGKAYMRNIADKVLVTKIEAVDDTYSRVYVDAAPFDVTTTTYISSMPLHSGQTDAVLGNDGYVANDGKHSFKIQGVEDGIGAYFVSSNEVMYKVTATKTIFYHRNFGDYTSDLAAMQKNWKNVGEFESPNSADVWIGEVNIDLETGAEVIRTIGSGEKSGTGDRYYFGGNRIGLLEHLSRGLLLFWSGAGASCLFGGRGLSTAGWDCAACVS